MGLNILVAIEIFYPQINGLITTTMNLVKNFKKLGHNPIIFTPRVLKNTPEVVEDIPVYYIPSTDASYYPGMRNVKIRHPLFREIIESQKIDIVQTTAPWFLAKGLNRVAKKKHIPIVNTFHTNIHNPSYMRYMIPHLLTPHTEKIIQNIVLKGTRTFIGSSDVLVAPSPATCKDLRTHFPKKEVRWIPNGVEIEIFKQNSNEHLLEVLLPVITEKNLKYAIFIGRLAQEKSVDILLKATAMVVQAIPNFRLVIIGDGPKREELKALAKNLNISENVRFLGKVDNAAILKSKIIHNAHFFTTASLTETHSMTVTEALCCGTPVVVANHESMTYFTGGCAAYFEPNNPASMAQTIIKMWNDSSYYNPLKEQAVNMLDSFDGMKIAKQYISLYEEILSKKKKATTL